MSKKIKQEVVKLGTETKPPDTYAGLRISKAEKAELHGAAKSIGLSFTQFVLGSCRFVKGKL